MNYCSGIAIKITKAAYGVTYMTSKRAKHIIMQTIYIHTNTQIKHFLIMQFDFVIRKDVWI